LNLSFFPAALSSILNVGVIESLLNPQLNSINYLEGTISLFSSILCILKCMVDTLHSWGNKVDSMNGLFIFSLICYTVRLLSYSKIIERYVPFIGKPSF
jgi:hypothetical protein